jgi:hypothetical protein
VASPDTPDLDDPDPERAEDAPLYWFEPDRQLQRHTVPLVVLTFIAATGCACVVAIATGSVPAALVLAAAVAAIVRRVFPK